MNIYEDYVNYMGECQELIEKMLETSSSIYYVISDVIKVCDYVYQEYSKNNKLDEDLEEIFEVGFGYISNVLGDLKTYFEDYYNKDIDAFNYYAELMLYSVYIDDYKGHLEVRDLLNNDIEKELNDLSSKIDNILINKKQYDESLVLLIDAKIGQLQLKDDDYKTVYNVFQMIAETLELE